jgi:hypothetical protein
VSQEDLKTTEDEELDSFITPETGGFKQFFGVCLTGEVLH